VLSGRLLRAYYLKGQKVRALIAQTFRDAFTKVDAIVTPHLHPVPALSWRKGRTTRCRLYHSDIIRLRGSLAGVPGISVPCEDRWKAAGGLADFSGPPLARAASCNWHSFRGRGRPGCSTPVGSIQSGFVAKFMASARTILEKLGPRTEQAIARRRYRPLQVPGKRLPGRALGRPQRSSLT